MRIEEMFKVPFRPIYCETLKGWIVECFVCFYRTWIEKRKPIEGEPKMQNCETCKHGMGRPRSCLKNGNECKGYSKWEKEGK